MRVLIDAHMLGQQETGNEVYIANLLSGLDAIPEITCAAVFSPGYTSYSFKNIESLTLPTEGNWHRLAYALSAVCKEWQADILHVTYNAPFTIPCKLVVSVHDVSFKRYPNAFSHRDRLLFATLLPLTLHRAAAVITLSQHARDELSMYYPFLQEKIHVTYLAAGNRFVAPGEVEAGYTIREKYHVEPGYILAVGNLQPRKNLNRLLEAFATTLPELPRTTQLVIVGKAHWQASTVYQAIEELGITDRVVLTGYVPDDDLPALYCMASLFVYPSLYEGFGLPVLEAMACGTPVITSNVASLPEVAGESAILVDPYQVEEIAQAMQRVMTDHDLAKGLSRKGGEHVKQFSWLKTARETYSIYQSAMERNRPYRQ